MKKSTKKIFWCMFAVYVFAMLWLLFGRSQFDIGREYWEQIQMNINVVPFHTIRQYLYLLIHRPNPHLTAPALLNLLGNIAAFVPLGFFLPCLWKRLRAFWRFILSTTAVVTMVELVQLFTLRGSCDIDDLILNVLGSLIGFAGWTFISKKIHRAKDSGKRKEIF